MSKAHLVVLGFVHKHPMYGYRIGQIVEEQKFPVWAGIKLPSIYKAMQTLEEKKYISGEQVSEGNNPPRTVYSLTPTGKKYFFDLVESFLIESQPHERDFWLALSFADGAVTRKILIKAVEKRITKMEELLSPERIKGREGHMLNDGMPFVFKYMFQLAKSSHEGEMNALQDLREDILKPENDAFFKE